MMVSLSNVEIAQEMDDVMTNQIITTALAILMTRNNITELSFSIEEYGTTLKDLSAMVIEKRHDMLHVTILAETVRPDFVCTRCRTNVGPIDENGMPDKEHICPLASPLGDTIDDVRNHLILLDS